MVFLIYKNIKTCIILFTPEHHLIFLKWLPMYADNWGVMQSMKQ